MGGMTVDSLRAAIAKIAPHMVASADALNTADGKLGDGDLGITMVRGMTALLSTKDSLPDDMGMAFLRCAKEFTKVSGSSYGALLAIGLMSAAKVCKGKTEVQWNEVSALFAGALDAMMTSGKASLGDKTVLDTLDAMRRATVGIAAPEELLAACDEAISETLDAFRGRISKLGRARMYGEKSIGLDDPGMLALRKVVDALSGPSDPGG